ncbi:MAG: 3-deoxy-D-manno-octulosonic acid transferase [Muribaculaceae bacterium]|nr:3-deoxy-D-manno-octulosonic acid transferase [Muribaculaceae bacterium]
MNPLYNLGIHLYGVAARAAAPFSHKIAQMLHGRRETLRMLRDSVPQDTQYGFDSWFHVASLGEFEQARPIIERLKAADPSHRILVTFFSPSGYNVRCNYELADAVAYLPADTPERVSEFLDIIRPRRAIFVKYEFWGNMLQELHRRAVPTYLICAHFRQNQIFFKPYGGFMRKVLSYFTSLVVQDEASVNLLRSAGIPAERITVAGDTRFDRVERIISGAQHLPEIERFKGGSPLLVAGSSWQPDEDCYIPWLHAHPEVKAIVAPHEFDNQRIEKLRQTLGSDRTAVLSECKDGRIPDEASYLIVDCFGLLVSLYRYADVALIGGGLGAGIHNITEAVGYGVPVVFGPRYSKFREAVELVKRSSAASYNSASSLDVILTELFADPELRRKRGAEAAEYFAENLGATDTIYNLIYD